VSKRLSDKYRLLVKAARTARKKAHAPYSHFKVGAALLTNDGQVYSGCNIENSSYGLTICAERTALFKGISEGARKFRAIAIVADEASITPPCGACRQVLWELAGNIDVLLPAGTRTTVKKLQSLLPIAFDSKRLSRRKKRKL